MRFTVRIMVTSALEAVLSGVAGAVTAARSNQ
jgi:hypothetical protein